nr:uncharacterized protein LOC106678530 [Halyomorpha halys]
MFPAVLTMATSRLNDVFKEVEQFTQFQRILGMSAYIYSNGKFQVSRKWLIVSLINISGNLLIFIYTLHSIKKSLSKVSHWYSFLKTAYSLVLPCGIVASWIRSNRYLDLFNASLFKMRAVDLQLFSLGKVLPPTKPSWVTFLIFVLLLVAFFLKAPTMPTFLSCIQLLILYAPYIHIISVEDIIDRIDSMLLLRFNALTMHLFQCTTMEAKKAANVLEKLILCYDQLSSSSVDIDEYLGVQVISVLMLFFLASFCEIYATSLMYRDDSLNYKGQLLVEKVLWIIVMIVILSRVCHQFAAITTEAKKFDMLLYQLMIDDKTNNILNNQIS